jgi:hypothetical protein
MREAYAHDAVVAMPPDGDLAAPGAAITVALCGHWEHEGPCPLAPHHTAAERAGDAVNLRLLFATEPDREAEVRERVEAALAAGWTVRASAPAAVRPAEAEHARRLAAG